MREVTEIIQTYPSTLGRSGIFTITIGQVLLAAKCCHGRVSGDGDQGPMACLNLTLLTGCISASSMQDHTDNELDFEFTTDQLDGE